MFFFFPWQVESHFQILVTSPCLYAHHLWEAVLKSHMLRGAGKMVRWVRVLVACTEDLGSDPSTHAGSSQPPEILASGGLTPSSDHCVYLLL